MSTYLQKKLRQAKEIINELEAYFEGKNQGSSITTKKEVHYNPGDNSYELPPGMNEDFFIDYLENKSHTSSGDSLVNEKEEIDLPKLKEGSISKRKDGRWMGRYYQDGVQKCLYASTQKECISLLKQAIIERNRINKDKDISKRISLNNWIQEWLKLYKNGVKESTKVDYQTNLINKLKNHPLGKKQISHITSIDVERFLNSIEAPAARARTFRQLKSCMQSLYKHKLIKEDIFSIIQNIPEPKNKKRLPSNIELEKFFIYLKDAYYEIYLFARFLSLTGLRKGEALALKWTDFKDSKIHITKAYEVKAKKVQSPKTRASVRTVPLFDSVKKLLIEIKRLSNSDEVFSFIYKTSIDTRFKHHKNKFGIEELTLHSLRHVFATSCYEAGIDEKMVQVWMGHANYKTTKDTYTHINSKFENEQIAKMKIYSQEK